MHRLSYLTPVSDEPRETYIERYLVMLRKALAEHPEDKLLLMQPILLYMHLKEDDDEVIRYAFELLEIDKEKKYFHDIHIVLARSYAHKNDNNMAIEYYRKIITTDPSEEAITELAELYEKTLDIDNALKVYDYFDNKDFEDGKETMFRKKGMLYYNRRNFNEALDCYLKAYEISLDKTDGWLIENIGASYGQINNFEESSKWFKKALEKNPQSAQAHYNLGYCYQNTNDSYRALHHYFEALKIDPNYTNAYNNIAAVTINDEGDIKKGIEMLKKALESTSDKTLLTQVYQNLSGIYRRLCEYDLADYYKAEFLRSTGLDMFITESDEDDEDVPY